MIKTPKLRFKEFSGDWETGIISDYGYFYYGKSAPKWSITTDATIPCIRYGELYTTHNEIVKEIKTYTNISKENLKFSKGGEVLVPRVGEKPLEFSKCTYLPFKDIAIGEMISVYNTNQNPLFIVYYFRSKMKYKFARMVEGGNVSNLYYSYLEKIHVSIPSKEEQNKIASFFSLIDNKISLQGEKVEVLKDYKKGIMQMIFNRKLRFKDDGRDYPKWEEKKLGNLIYEPKKTKEEELQKQELLTVKLHCLGIESTGKYPNNTKNGRPYYKRFKGELLIGRQSMHNGGMGIVDDKCDGLIASNAISSYRNNENVSIEFIYYTISRVDYYRRIDLLIGGTAQKEISKKELENLIVEIPCLEEQNKISNFISNIDVKFNKEQKKLRYLNEYKKGLLQQMFV